MQELAGGVVCLDGGLAVRGEQVQNGGWSLA